MNLIAEGSIQCLAHFPGSISVNTGNQIYMGIQVVVLQERSNDPLGESGGMQVGGLFGDDQFFHYGLWRNNPTDAQTWGDDLGKGTEEDGLLR